MRALDANGDMQFGGGSANFLVNSAEAVAQNVRTALGLIQGEWFLDQTAGVPWWTKVLGRNTAGARDQVIRTAILGVQGVTGIASYSSMVVGRALSISASIGTSYGPASVVQLLTPAPGLAGGALNFADLRNSDLITVI